MNYYASPNDDTMSEAERALTAIEEARTIQPSDGPRPTPHPEGPCRYALHGCRTCSDRMAAEETRRIGQRAAERALHVALGILFPATGDNNGA